MATQLATGPAQWTDNGSDREIASRINREDAELIIDLINHPAIAPLETLYANAGSFAKRAVWLAAAASSDRRAFAWLRYVGGTDSVKAEIRAALWELGQEGPSA
ncbi:hypothetical protein LZ016_13780 [Sphingomonas sp. SM33]|uniref:HEAT repeat domain-containing protein n=1 Tax=Sphingomonas telluris TaxID=2907998 RepID=A0ABS9VR23_9SPHN|nr:hypothetical protein [Sphingomonas telluris]MCH8617163.1 hypothetical protein [Sphingomonas telluris]